uniref:Conserved plasma membrane protein n=1 Tax=Angiostrongylus cantonensis TaxID=6313 RepID=A0A0K0D542_ANGCA
LHVAPVREEDQISVSLEALLGGGAASGARISGWWIAFFILIAICLALICCVAFCVRRGVLCFNRVKEQSDYEPKAKANLNVRENFYDAEAPRLYTPQSIENAGSYHEGVNYAEMRLMSQPPASSSQPTLPPRPLLQTYASSVQSIV